MKRFHYLTALVILFTFGCEPDDICLENTPGTPSLVVVFYDHTQPDVKKQVADLEIKGAAVDLVFHTGTTDSIAIPIKTIENNTSFDFKSTQDTTTLTDLLQFTYAADDQFISRACGFKTTYEDLEISVENPLNWIKGFEIINTSISDINNTHVKILH